MKINKPHFQIPNEETSLNPVKHRLIPKPKEMFDYTQHSTTLSNEINTVLASSTSSMFNVSNIETIFKIKLDDDQKIEQRGRYDELFTNQGMTVRALLGESEAIVSSTETNIRQLLEKIKKYGFAEENRKTWDYVKEISIIHPEEKIDTSLAESAKVSSNVDVNVIISGVLDYHDSNQLESLLAQLKDKYPKQSKIETAKLSDDTLSTHMIVPSSALNELANENFVLSIEKNNYFVSDTSAADSDISLLNSKLDTSVDIDELPVVAIIDDGINLPGELAATVKSVYQLANGNAVDKKKAEHGTKVASRCIFGEDLNAQAIAGVFKPRVQVIDVPIMSTSNSGTELINKIRQVVEDLHEECATFLLAYNSPQPFSTDNVSMLGAEIDSLIYQYGINFIIPSGNHNLQRFYSSENQLMEDFRTRISAPADGFLLTSVGSISQSGSLSTFSRTGYGFNGSMKPGLVYPGGNIPFGVNNKQNNNEFIQVIDCKGNLSFDTGTSFSSPLAAADIAIVQQYCLKTLISSQKQTNNPTKIASFEAKSLMYHRGSEANTMPFNQQLGFGKTNLEKVLFSAKDDATYIHFGSLKRKQRLHITFLVPKVLESIKKRGKASLRISVTVVDFPSARRINGKDYLDGYIYTSFHNMNSNGTKTTTNPSSEQGRQRWSNIHHFSQDFSAYQSGDWELTLEYFSRPSVPDDDEIDYVVLISIEDITGLGVDLYSEIESTNRFNIRNFIAVDNETSIKEESTENE